MNRCATRGLTMLCAAGAALAVAGAVVAHETEDMNAQHPDRAMRSTVQYTVPAVTLMRDDGKSVSLPAEMNDGKPVVLDFVFTSCGSICPLMSQIFSEFQRKLGAEAAGVHLISISTDPEQDTPERLTEYARQFHAGPEWRHYTGTLAASLSAQRAFDVYRGDKMSHTPVILLRAAPGQPWRRIDGFITPDELLREFRQLRAVQ